MEWTRHLSSVYGSFSWTFNKIQGLATSKIVKNESFWKLLTSTTGVFVFVTLDFNHNPSFRVATFEPGKALYSTPNFWPVAYWNPKSRQGPSHGGLASRGGPEFLKGYFAIFKLTVHPVVAVHTGWHRVSFSCEPCFIHSHKVHKN